MSAELKAFVESCQSSSGRAYELFKTLLVELDDKKTRTKSIKFLHQLNDYYYATSPRQCHFHFLTQQVLGDNDQSYTLKLLQFPSTFLPEAWSFTFYEGLVRYPASEYENKQVVELGCGIGWITIALAIRYGLKNIVGVDINPKAIVCARLNLYLNAFDENAKPIIYRQGENVLDQVRFYESNLFSHFQDQAIRFDKIIGCIPQVLNPEPEIMENIIEEEASDEYLYSLSNYFAKQGFIEDQFGLGLIASAVEQAIPLIAADGKLILNLGGRPGRAVLERLMRRRGFNVRRVWQTQVEQAADTEIDALVEIEKTIGHRFEFYMSANSEVTIDATAASAYARAGGKIYHSVDVYEAELLFPEKVKAIFETIEKVDDNALRSAIDLTYDNQVDAEERYSFLAFLAKRLEKIDNYPYRDTRGMKYFRQQIAEYFGYYLKVMVAEEQLLISPGRKELFANLLLCYQPKLTLISKDLSGLISSENKQANAVIETPKEIEYLLALIERLKPSLVITNFDRFEVASTQLIKQLIQCAEKNNVLLVVDLTEHINLSSEPKNNGVYRYLSDNPLPANLLLTAALINNRVYEKYSLNITMAGSPTLVKHLADAAELTYSRTPTLKQLYYGHLLEELLYFQRTRITAQADNNEPKKVTVKSPELSDSASKAFQHPAIAGNHLPFNNETIRLDYGENELPAPQRLNDVLMESYLVRKCVANEDDPTNQILGQLGKRFNLPQHYNRQVVLGHGVAAVFTGLLEICAAEKKRIFIPGGSYGYFLAAAELQSLEASVIPTQQGNSFKISGEDLLAQGSRLEGSWLFLNAPIVNPTGAIYSQKELEAIFDIVSEYNMTLVLDGIFSGLEFEGELSHDIAKYSELFVKKQNARILIMGGISKEYAAGGLRFGYAWSTSTNLLNQLDEKLAHKPHFTLKYAVRKLLASHLDGNEKLLAHQAKQKLTLKDRAERLTNVLIKQGWQVIPPQGGLFMVAKPPIEKSDNSAELTRAADEYVEQLFEKQNIAINNSTWTGLPGYCRFVLSCGEAAFEEAMIRLVRD